MPIVIISDRDTKAWVQAIKTKNPGLNLRQYPEDRNREEIEYALVWNHPRGLLKEYPNLKVIASMGAGVDHILNDPDLPKHVAITRIVEPQLAEDMAEFVLALIMDHLRNLSLHKGEQGKSLWQPRPYLRIQETKIGIMGLGNLGATVGTKLIGTGFKVRGWARSPKNIKGMEVFVGDGELEAFLAETNILVCLLPLTPSTENILDGNLLGKLPKNAYLINVARGNHLVEEHLLEQIDSGHLSGAALDVFQEEPLPKGHPFWKHPKILVTPHIASVTKPSAVVSQILENYDRMRKSRPLLNEVNREKGY